MLMYPEERGGSRICLFYKRRLLAFVVLCLLGSCAYLPSAVSAQEQRLTVATKESPPFSMRGADGQWEGLSIALWKAMSTRLGIEYQFEEASLADLITGIEEGRYDVSIAAITMTHERERRVDFSHPYYSTGYGIVVRHQDSSWLGLLNGLLSAAFLQAVGFLILILSLVGTCFWLAERHKNKDEFRPGIKGLGDAFWFSAVTMTTTGYGDMAPRTGAGRLVGLVWMFTALIITSTFTGMIASSLTAEKLQETVEGPDDLYSISTGSIAGSSSDEWLRSYGLGFTPFSDVHEGLAAVAQGDVASFVYDRPLLRHEIDLVYSDELELVPGTFGREDYAIVLPAGSTLRESLNRALLDFLATDEWVALQRRWLGS